MLYGTAGKGVFTRHWGVERGLWPMTFGLGYVNLWEARRNLRSARVFLVSLCT